MISLSLLKHERHLDAVYGSKEFFCDGNPLRFLVDLQPINILVGANNTRKSRFFRFLMEQDSFLVWQSTRNFEFLISELEDNLGRLKNGYTGLSPLILIFPSVGDNPTFKLFSELTVVGGGSNTFRVNTDRIINQVGNILETILICSSRSEFELIKRAIKKILEGLAHTAELICYLYQENTGDGNKSISKSTPNILTVLNAVRNGELINSEMLAEIIQKLHDLLNEVFESVVFDQQVADIIYIPVLRTSKTLPVNGDIFEKMIKQQMPKLNPKVSVHTGLSLNDKILRSRNSSRMAYRDFLAFEEFIAHTFFDGKEINIIAQFDTDGEISISLPNERENVSVNDLGDGVTGVINLLYPLFTASAGSWVFIEEPENNLHPAFQNIFVKALSENLFIKEKNLRVFINTHSNHVLINSYISGEGISISVFSKRDQDSSNVTSYIDNHKDTLDMLGVLNTSVLVSNCLLWVEGITDRLYLKAYLYAYLAFLNQPLSFREGLDYSFIEYGGANIVHYEFETIDSEQTANIRAFYTNNRILVLADKDKNSKGREHFAQVKNKHFVYIDTGLLEIENLLPDVILMDFLQSIGADDNGIKKINFSEKQQKKLGEVFEGIRSKKGRKIAIQSKFGGTLADFYKKGLAEFFYQKVQAGDYPWETLKTESHIVRITKRIFDFIKNAKA